MWRTDTLWFDVAIVMSIFAVGNILFGRFEEHRSRGSAVHPLTPWRGSQTPCTQTATSSGSARTP